MASLAIGALLHDTEAAPTSDHSDKEVQAGNFSDVLAGVHGQGAKRERERATASSDSAALNAEEIPKRLSAEEKRSLKAKSSAAEIDRGSATTEQSTPRRAHRSSATIAAPSAADVVTGRLPLNAIVLSASTGATKLPFGDHAATQTRPISQNGTAGPEASTSDRSLLASAGSPRPATAAAASTGDSPTRTPTTTKSPSLAPIPSDSDPKGPTVVTGAALIADANAVHADHPPTKSPSIVQASTEATAELSGAPATTVLAAVGSLRAASASPSGSALPSVANQLTSVLSPLRQTATGGHVVSLTLQPNGLGDVRATMTLNANQLVIRLTSSNPDGEAALRAALPDLHADLSTSSQQTTLFLTDARGNATASFGEGHQGGGNGSGEGANGALDSRPSLSPEAVAGPTTAPVSESSSLLDVRI